MYIRLISHEPFGMAGIYSVWRSPEGQDICTCTIITTDANERLRPIHDGMPVIIPKEQENFWLNPKTTDGDKLKAILVPYPSDAMECHEVWAAVNKPDYDSPEAIVPIPPVP